MESRGLRRFVTAVLTFVLCLAHGTAVPAQDAGQPSTACETLAVIQARASGMPEPDNIMAVLDGAATEVTNGRDPNCAARVAAAFINHGLPGRAVEVSQVVAARYPGMPAARCVNFLARLVQIQRAASVRGGAAPVACERDHGLTEVLADGAQECFLMAERVVTRAVIASLRDVAFVCRDTGAIAAAFGAFVVDVPPDERSPELVLLVQLLRHGTLPFHLTDAVLVARLREWMVNGAPSLPTVTVLHARARDLLLRLRPPSAANDASTPTRVTVQVNDAVLITARALLGASGRLSSTGSGSYGRQIADLELAWSMGLLEQPVVSEAAATMPLWQLAGAALSSDARERINALRERLRTHSAPTMCLVRFRLALSAGVREASQEPCDRARAVAEATTEFLHCDGSCALPVERYARELHNAADEGLAAARECASGAVAGDEFERILRLLERGECPRETVVDLSGATTTTQPSSGDGGVR